MRKIEKRTVICLALAILLAAGLLVFLVKYAADGGKGAEGSVLSYGRDDDLCRLLRSAVFLLQSYVDTADCVCNFQPENIKSDKK